MRNQTENKNSKYGAGSGLLHLLGGLLTLAGGCAALCGFGMSDAMSAPTGFCMMLSACGVAAFLIGLRLSGCRPGREKSRLAGGTV